MSRLTNQHVADNLEDYVQGSIPAKQRRILLSQWVGQAWEELSTNKEMAVRSFRKCGISLPIDGSADQDIHIEGISEYCVRGLDDEDEMEAAMDDDRFADIN